MIKRVLTILLLSIFVLQLVSATDTNIKIKTVSNSEVYLTILDSSTSAFSSLGIFSGESDLNGNVNFTYSGDESIFDLMVVIKKFNERIYSNKFREDYPAGEDIYLEIEPEGYTLADDVIFEEANLSEETNQTSNETLNQTSLPENDSFGITGMTISNSSKSSFKFLYYILGFVALLTLGYFGLRFKGEQKPHRIKVVKLSELRAQEQTNSLEKEKRVKELQESISRDKEELDRLSRR